MQLTKSKSKFTLHVVTLLCFSLALNISCECFADDAPTASDEIHELKTAQFVIYTDLDKAAAQTHLRGMKTALANATKYWGRSLKGEIRCYLIEDLSNWKNYKLPVEQAKLIVRRIGGATIVDPEATAKHRSPQAFIYASTAPGVVEHEVIHAYCFQTFGTAGPDWYREGMAELLAMNATPRKGAVCRERNLDALGADKDPSLRRILTRTDVTNSIADLIGQNPLQKEGVEFDITPLEDWSKSTSPAMLKAHVAYAESWALCYLLYHNPNYQRRFRMVGKHLLTNPRARFEDAFEPMMENIDFELKQLAQHMGDGYRADLSSWEWNQSFSDIKIGRTVSLKLKAMAGYQGTGIKVKPNEKYEIHATGEWIVDQDEPRTTANGNIDGHGKIEAVLLKDFSLHSSQVMGEAATYYSTKDGQLYLRCHDDWRQLADNRGVIKVRIKRIQ